MNWYLISSCTFLVILLSTVAIRNFRAYKREKTSWDSWFNGPGVTPDALNERNQPPEQRR